MIIWSGWGLIVPGIALIVALVMTLIFENILGLTGIMDTKWMTSLWWIISGVICWYTGNNLNKPTGRIFIDKATGQEFREGGGQHRLFFIRVEYWAIVMGLVAITSFFQ